MSMREKSKFFGFVVLVCLSFVFMLWGCGKKSDVKKKSGYEPKSSISLPEITRGEYKDERMPSSEVSLMEATLARINAAPSAPKPNEVPFNQRVIRTAEMRIRVKTVKDAMGEVRSIVEKVNGYIVEDQLSEARGRHHEGRIVLRIPVRKFYDVQQSLEALGTTVKRSSSGQDVTEEYVDLESRIKNLKKAEERLHQILDKEGYTLEKILRIEQEYNRIRGQIEQLEGRLRKLESQTSYSTIRLALFEEEPVVTVQEVDSSLSGTASDAGRSVVAFSLDLLAALIWIAVFLPYIILLFVVILLIRKLLRRIKIIGKSAGSVKNDQDESQE